jgi:ketosteroid isomerase-like protein
MRRISAPVIIALCIAWQVATAQSAGEQIVAALERYRQAVLELDIEHEVSSFTEDAELALGGEPVVQGRTTIRSLLLAPNADKVVAYDLHVAATRVLGATAVQNGVYSQRSISPQHQALLVKGVFEVQWARQSDGSWLISSLHLDPVESVPS